MVTVVVTKSDDPAIPSVHEIDRGTAWLVFFRLLSGGLDWTQSREPREIVMAGRRNTVFLSGSEDELEGCWGLLDEFLEQLGRPEVQADAGTALEESPEFEHTVEDVESEEEWLRAHHNRHAARLAMIRVVLGSECSEQLYALVKSWSLTQVVQARLDAKKTSRSLTDVISTLASYRK